MRRIREIISPGFMHYNPGRQETLGRKYVDWEIMARNLMDRSDAAGFRAVVH